MKKQAYLLTLLLTATFSATPTYAADANSIELSSPLASCPANPNIPNNTAFYPGKAHVGKSNNLANNVGSGFLAKGQIIRIKGRILNTFCQPATGALVEIWQADADGDVGKDMESYFVGSGKTYTNNLGEFQFITILPGQSEDDQAPYINFAVSHPQMEKVNTIMFFPDHPLNTTDELYNSMTESGFAEPAARATGKDEFEYNISITGTEHFKEL